MDGFLKSNSEVETFQLRWKRHWTNLCSTLDHNLAKDTLCDVTLSCSDTSLQCHRMVLSAGSWFFRNLLLHQESAWHHPIIILPDVTSNEIKPILEFMYSGELQVEHEDLERLLQIAEDLKIRGLVKLDKEDEEADPICPLVIVEKDESIIEPSSPITNDEQMHDTEMESIEETENGKLVIDEESIRSVSRDGIRIGDFARMENGFGHGSNGSFNGSGTISVKTDLLYSPNSSGNSQYQGKMKASKSYKQYDRNDILAAIEDVKNGMSALKASKKYGIPSRTLYDKIKKMGISTPNMINIKKGQEKKEEARNSSDPQMLWSLLPQASLPNSSIIQRAATANLSILPQSSLSNSPTSSTSHNGSTTILPHLFQLSPNKQMSSTNLPENVILEKKTTSSILGNMMSSPIPGNIKPSPILANILPMPSPIPGNIKPAPVSGNMTSSPIPGNIKPSPIPGNMTTSSLLGDMRGSPIPGNIKPSPIPANMTTSSLLEDMAASSNSNSPNYASSKPFNPSLGSLLDSKENFKSEETESNSDEVMIIKEDDITDYKEEDDIRSKFIAELKQPLATILSSKQTLFVKKQTEIEIEQPNGEED